MTPEQIFSIANLVAIVPWIMLVVLPRQRWVTDIVTSIDRAAAVRVVYVVIVVTTFGRTPGGVF